jgi:methionyl aminopeptidase
MVVDDAVRYCAANGCRNEANVLQCPTCVQKNLPPTYYCSQTCFKGNWGVHKYFHSSVVDAEDFEWMSWRPEFRGFQFTGTMRPDKLTRRRFVPDTIVKPDYADDPDGTPFSESDRERIPIYTDPEDIQNLREAGRLCAEVLTIGGKIAREGVTTDEIDRVIHDACIERNIYPSPLNYNTFPKSCCTSINEIVCHGIPDMRELQSGDIMNLDISVYYNGFHSDMNEMFFIGDVDDEARHLVNTTKECLDIAIAHVKPGLLFREIGNIISKHAQANKLSVARAYCGHGVGRLFHCAPDIPHYGKNRAIGVVKAGQVFSIEPMINSGTYHEFLWADNWSSSTNDGKKSAQFEHTLFVTSEGCEILTSRQEGDYINRF